MAENRPPPPPSSSSRPPVPTIGLPPRSTVESLFLGGPGASPGPMSLVSSFFSENDPDSDCRSFSQLLAGAVSPAAVPNARQNFAAPSAEGRSEGDGNREFRFQQSRPGGFLVSQPDAMFTIPVGLSPASLLDSPGFFASAQGPYGMSNQQFLAQISAQVQAQGQMPNHSGYQSLSSAPPSSLPSNSSLQHKPPPISDPSNAREWSDVSHLDHKSQFQNVTVDKPSDDGYNWRKYGQKQVKGSEFPRSYYKCTKPNCPVKKKVERSLDGQITEIIYKGQHNHPAPSKRPKDIGNSNGTMNGLGNSEFGSEDFNKNNEGTSHLHTKDQESSQATPEHISGSSDSEEVGNADAVANGRDEDEPEPKRRSIEVQNPEHASSHRTVTEPRIIVQTTSEVDLLDDGYRWRKYGQKVVKGNPYPRSYYKCTSQGCNVRKHVERAASDPKAVITTYEGKHTHDVPAAKSSSHNTASTNSQSRTNNNDRQMVSTRTGFGGIEEQPVALLRFKEEQIT